MKNTLALLVLSISAVLADPTFRIETNIVTIPARQVTNRVLVVIDGDMTNVVNLDAANAQMRQARAQQLNAQRQRASTNAPVHFGRTNSEPVHERPR